MTEKSKSRSRVTPGPSTEIFSGFPPEAVRFLRQLKRNNNRKWFDAHREDYQEQLRAPSKAFLLALQDPMKKAFPAIIVSPRSMFRINRDTRFSSDKSPYKTWVGYDFKDCRGEKEAAPSLYLGWDPSGVLYGAGNYQFTTAHRELFRHRITEGASAREFTKIVRSIRKKGRFEFRGEKLKRHPAGYDPAHPNAEFLRYNFCYVLFEEDMPRDFYSAAFLKRTVKFFSETKPLMDWLAEVKLPATAPRVSAQELELTKKYKDDF